ESIDTILELAKLKERGSCRVLIVTGCLTQRYGGDILTEMPEIDGILGTANLSRIVELVGQAAGRHDWATSAPPGYLYDATTPRLLQARVPYAYVKIAEGCDMGCTFCAIPQFRGRHRSRPLGDIVAEVAALARRGVQEAILVSQDTLAWGKDRHGEGDVGDLLLALGETPRDFGEEVRFERRGVFAYSPEEGTPALALPDPVPREQAEERAAIVQTVQDRIAFDALQSLRGTVQEVLVDGPSQDPAFQWEGRLAGQAPEIDGVVYLRGGGLAPARFERVRITDVEGYELVGEASR